jgi:hypothetical protein
LLSSAEFDTKEEVRESEPFKFVSPSVVLKKIQENSLEKANFFTKQIVQLMIVDDPVLVQLILRIFFHNNWTSLLNYLEIFGLNCIPLFHDRAFGLNTFQNFDYLFFPTNFIGIGF